MLYVKTNSVMNYSYDNEKDYCYPFRVLQKPEVGIVYLLTVF